MTGIIRTKKTFGRSERLILKSRIDQLFNKGISKRAGCLRIIYFFTGEILEAPVQVMFSVPKRQIHNAVDRNTIRRYMREAYRLHKNELGEQLGSDKKYVLLAFLFAGNQVENYQSIQKDVRQLLGKIDVS